MPHYVIVGAGSAGCVLAARLSEDPAAEVVLIEAGPPDQAQQIHIPVAWPQFFKSRYDWDYASEREPGLDRRRVYLPRGKTLGGSSSTNATAYIRGARANYDGWARDGAKGWAYDDLLPYFRRSEANERGEDQFHGKLGPWTVSDGRSRYSLMDAFVEAGVEAGHLRNPDFNGEKQDGLGLYRSRSATACAAAPPSPFFIPRLAVQT
jgi:choline dehydrogenase